MKKAQLVFIPSPGVGHLVSTLQFAKLLTNRDDRLRVTVLVIKFPHAADGETDAYTAAISSERIHVINLPETQVPPTSELGSAMNALLESQKAYVREAVSNIKRTELAAFVLDMFCTTMIDVAREFGVPSLVFFTSGVAFLGLMLHLHTLRERDNFDATRLPLQGSPTELTLPTFANSVPSNVLPSPVLRKEWEAFFMAYARGLKQANAFIVNSFEELESHAVHYFPDLGLHLPIYPVGPILNPEANGCTADSDPHDILKWLDDQPPSSVVFLCFGSRGSFHEDQVREIARALEDSGARFLWSLRKPQPKGSMAPPSDYSPPDLDAVLPQGFLDRTAGIGRVIGWAPQAQVLAHQATGGFVSHCGWNSTLESIYFGVPVATWPHFAEQQTNAFELVRELKIAVEIAMDYRVEFDAGPNFLLTADRIERGIRSVLDKDGEIRKKMKEMSDKSRKTLLEGGCSYTYLGRLIDYIMDQL